MTARAVATRLALVAVLTLGALLHPPPARAADTGRCWDHAPRCAALMQLRHDAGVPGLDQERDLQAYARAWAVHMAAGQVLEHSGGPWSETVGMGPDWRTVFAAFMASPRHRAIILDPGARDVGIGTQRDAERVWVVLVFR